MATQDILAGLNDKQQQAVQTTEGPVLIMAGAGSGKTRVLTHRIAYLLEEKDVLPWHILAITFTNKAANEMKARVAALVGDAGRDMWISTFHSMCNRILHIDGDAIGVPGNFSIVDTSARNTMMKRIVKELDLDDQHFNYKHILGQISDAKNALVTPEQYRATHTEYFEQKVADCYERYQAELAAAAALDFDDLIMKTVQLFHEAPDVLKKYQQRFQYIHVDEYQDTNAAQYELVYLLGDYFHNVCVVGDADQSIYGWRGADMENIFHFEEDYPNAQTILLEQNYRSTKTILKAANAVIQNNNHRKDKNLWTKNATGDLITYYRADNADDEAQFIATTITEWEEKGYHADDFAVLYRANAQSRVIEGTLSVNQIPYHIVGGTGFYERKEILDVLAYLNLLVNPNDNLSFRRIVNTPSRGIGAASLAKLETYANEHGGSLLQAAAHVEDTGIRGKARTSLLRFADMIGRLQQKRQHASLTELTEALLEESGYRAELVAKNTPESQSRLENLDEFLSVTKEYDEALPERADTDAESADAAPAPDDDDATSDLFAAARTAALTPSAATIADVDDPLANFLEAVTLDSGRQEESETEGVTLTTIHAAKGLEFPIVFLVGMEEEMFPTWRAVQDPTADAIEEERRLAYVAITRAEKKLFLTNAKSRFFRGRRQVHEPSRFVDEIDDALIEREDAPNADDPLVRRQIAGYHQTLGKKRSVFQSRRTERHETGALPDYHAGEIVYHRKWGEGVIAKTSGSGAQLELEVTFGDQKVGTKKLMAALAPIAREPFE